MTQHVERRTILKAASGAAALTAVAGASTVACTAGEAGDNRRRRNADVRLPEFVPIDKVKPDLPGNSNGLQPAFNQYPADPPAVSDGPIGNGGTVTAASPIATAIPAPMDRNPFWQNLNERIGVTVKVDFTPWGSYGAKFATLLAGDAVPDMAVVFPQPRMPDVLSSTFADLTEHLSGSGVRDYPNLANIPTYSWKSTVFNGGIFAVPNHRLISGNALLTRADIRRELNVEADPRDSEEFLELCRALNAPRMNRWALGSPSSALTFVLEMLGAPNVWREENGRFQSQYESEQMEEALTFVAKMWSEGLFHPDSLAKPGGSRNWFVEGRVCMLSWVTSWSSIATDGRQASPGFVISPIRAPKFNGNGFAPKFLATGCSHITAIKKASPERVAEILRVLNWIAAPWGSKEYIDVVYGKPTLHHTLKGSDPVWTDTGRTAFVPVNTLCTGPIVHQGQGAADVAKAEYDYEASVLPDAKHLPTLGLYSDTNQSQGAALTTKLTDLQNEIIQGRKTPADWREGVKTWKANGGDTIRREYEAALAED